MARRGFVRSRSVGAKRVPTWIGFTVNTTTIPANAAVLLASLSASALLLRPFTVIRTRALVHVLSDQAIANETPQGVVSLAVVSDTAAALGITALADGVSSPDGNFFVYQPYITRFQFITAAGFEGNSGSQYLIDSKAMRRVGADEDIVVVGADDTASFGATCIIQGRMLLKLD